MSQLVTSLCTAITTTIAAKPNLMDVNISKLSESALTDFLPYEVASFYKTQNKMVLAASIKFVVDSDKITGSIF